MKVVDVRIEELTKENFKEFGEVLDSDFAQPDAEECDFKFYYDLVEADFRDPVAISVVTSKLQDDLWGNSLEKHFKTEEFLAPLDGTIFVILTKTDASDEKKPDLATVRAFEVKPGQGVLLRSGTWHRCPLSEGKPVKTLCLVRKGTPTDNITYYLQDSYDIRFRAVR